MSTSRDLPPPLLRPEDLWARTLETTRHGLATGALQPIATECQTFEQQGIPFQVRLLGRVHLKDERTKREKPRAQRSEEHTLNSSHSGESRMPSSA